MSEIQHSAVTPIGQPRLAYSQAGAGPDVVLLHGALVNRTDMLLSLVPTLAEGCRVTAFDRPGHGDSGRVGPTGSPWRQAEAVHAAVQALGLDRPVVVGHSHGGAVALAYALQYPQHTRGVVALAPVVVPEVRLEHLLFAGRGVPFIGPMLNRTLAPLVDPALLPVLWRAMFLPQQMPSRFAEGFPFGKAARPPRTEAEGEDALLINEGLARSLINYSGCGVPVHVLWGRADVVVGGQHARTLERLLPNSKLEVLDGLGHMLHHFAQSRVAEAVARLAA